MGKRNKQQAKVAANEAANGNGAGNSALTTRQCHPRQLHLPPKQPTLLAVSIVLFALWFVFLLVTALSG
jgi:hypothetical protein